MSRPPRVQACGAFYHVTSRGNRRARIYADDFDYAAWLGMLGEAVARFQFIIHCYCLMPNHYHVVIETPLGNIAEGMHYLNGKYFQYFNRKHKLTGHVSQGRYHAELIQRDVHLMELARYVVRNPVRAGLVDAAEHWAWSSYRSALGLAPVPLWLTLNFLLGQFGKADAAQRAAAYRLFVQQAHDESHPLRRKARPGRRCRIDDPGLLGSIADFFSQFHDPIEAAIQAYASSAYSIRAIARHLKISPRSLMRLLRARTRQTS
jgi:REP element-mobilizing transposase RayT/AraC-like DNA-binding protein